MKILRCSDPDYAPFVETLNRRATPPAGLEKKVAAILASIAADGDDALLKLTRKLDGQELTPETMRVDPAEIRLAKVDEETEAALQASYRNVHRFARRSMRRAWSARNYQGAEVGERFDPLQRVGIYVPAGTAPLASTVLMTAGIAQAVGVPEIVVTTPVGLTGEVHPAVLRALAITGVQEVYKVGGAQAIAAMAYGTATIAPVEKIYGPGNAWVVEAKRQLFGTVGIDLLPGPSEVIVLADQDANPAWIAADLLAQAEHGHGSVAGFLTPSPGLLRKVEAEIERQAELSQRRDHLLPVLKEHCFLLQTADMEEAVAIVNAYAPEHLSIVAADDEALSAKVRTAGAIFLGPYSPIAAGDFLAGPSHELPTGGAGKAFAGLTSEQFQRRTSLVRLNEANLKKSLPYIEAFSKVEGLDAHGRSATIRFES